MGIFDYFQKIKNVFQQAQFSTQNFEIAKNKGNSKNLKNRQEAVQIAERIISIWSPNSLGQESLVTNIAFMWHSNFQYTSFSEFLKTVEKLKYKWQKIVNQAEKLIIAAQHQEKQEPNNPLQSQGLSQALSLYRECQSLIYSEEVNKAINSINVKLASYQQFNSLFQEGNKHKQQGYYQQALPYYLEAQDLFVIEEIEKAIAYCQNIIPTQVKYESSLNQIQTLAKNGNFAQAVSQLKLALAEFKRSDGESLLEKLEPVQEGIEYYQGGLEAEENNQYELANNHYEQALKLIPYLNAVKIRQAVIAIKTNNYEQALDLMQNLKGKESRYLRGLIYAKQKQYQQANQEWQSIDNSQIQSQRDILKKIVEREQLEEIEKINKLVNGQNFEQAKAVSMEFQGKFGFNLTVSNNLEKHIVPTIEKKLWSTQDWQNIAQVTAETWLEKQDIVSLHNWTIASYYRANIDKNKISELIISLFTCLANIELNPILKDIPWLGTSTINVSQVSQNIQQVLEDLIDDLKETDPEEYLKLRDQYRQESVALSLFQDCFTRGIKVNKLLITPGCYKRYQSRFPKVTLPDKLWGTLYTNWGEAVAACQQGDILRALTIKPQDTPSNQAEKYASAWVNYHEGYYHLQQQAWRLAMEPLKRARNIISFPLNWREDLDQVCDLVRKDIEDINEHLQFAQFWYDLVTSKPSKTYLVEYKARDIAIKYDNQTLNSRKALQKLKEIEAIDPENPLLINFIAEIEFNQEAENIDRLIKNDLFIEAVEQAKRSSHPRIRYRMAEVCIDILLNGAKNRNLPPETIMEIGTWAYELCPNEPTFQEIFRSLRLR